MWSGDELMNETYLVMRVLLHVEGLMLPLRATKVKDLGESFRWVSKDQIESSYSELFRVRLQA